jgi:hypothetical protein
LVSCDAPKVLDRLTRGENGAHALAVLVVEDDFFVRYDIAGCLRDAGYAVIESERGEEALARVNPPRLNCSTL